MRLCIYSEWCVMVEYNCVIRHLFIGYHNLRSLKVEGDQLVVQVNLVVFREKVKARDSWGLHNL